MFFKSSKGYVFVSRRTLLVDGWQEQGVALSRVILGMAVWFGFGQKPPYTG